MFQNDSELFSNRFDVKWVLVPDSADRWRWPSIFLKKWRPGSRKRNARGLDGGWSPEVGRRLSFGARSRRKREKHKVEVEWRARPRGQTKMCTHRSWRVASSGWGRSWNTKCGTSLICHCIRSGYLLNSPFDFSADSGHLKLITLDGAPDDPRNGNCALVFYQNRSIFLKKFEIPLIRKFPIIQFWKLQKSI